MKRDFMSPKDSDWKGLMYSKSDSKEIVAGFDTEKLFGEFFKWLFYRYHVGLQQ